MAHNHSNRHIIAPGKALLGKIFGTSLALTVLCSAHFTAVAQNDRASAQINNFIQSIVEQDDILIDPSDFVRIDHFNGHISVADYVDKQVQTVSQVTKIGYGQIHQVNVTTTSTGTYSSDALLSANVQYPGVKLVPKPSEIESSLAYGNHFNGLLVHTRKGYISIPHTGIPSYQFLFYTPHNGTVAVSPTNTCIYASQAIVCN